jgi:drug/metabolite transporter (DMT)-like permease
VSAIRRGSAPACKETNKVQRSQWHEGWYSRGILAALGAAILFGVGTPLAKQLLTTVNPWLLAGLLYSGSGLGLTIWRLARRSPRVRPTGSEWLYLAAAIGAGGVAAPVLLMQGLAGMPASGASLLLNAESVLTALLAWFVFRENFDRRIALGMLAIATGARALSWSPGASLRVMAPALLVLGACLGWAIDNNVTRKLALLDATWLAAIKGLAAGAVNLVIASALGAAWPSPPALLGALAVGAFAYGASLSLFVVALRYLGAARTSAYFSSAPFVGVLVGIVWLRDPLTGQFLLALALMSAGIWLHLSERHSHSHFHPALEHEHEHTHDEHHHHPHSPGDVRADSRHTHWHRHEPIEHTHDHFPDSHHQHEHK